MEIVGYNLRFDRELGFVLDRSILKKHNRYYWDYQTYKVVRARYAYKTILEQDGFFIPINGTSSFTFKKSHYNILCKELTYPIFLLYLNAAFDYRNSVGDGGGKYIEYNKNKKKLVYHL